MLFISASAQPKQVGHARCTPLIKRRNDNDLKIEIHQLRRRCRCYHAFAFWTASLPTENDDFSSNHRDEVPQLVRDYMGTMAQPHDAVRGSIHIPLKRYQIRSIISDHQQRHSICVLAIFQQATKNTSLSRDFRSLHLRRVGIITDFLFAFFIGK